MNLTQRKIREEIYEGNAARVSAHNTDYNNGITSFAMDCNQFADLSLEEWAAQVRKIFCNRCLCLHLSQKGGVLLYWIDQGVLDNFMGPLTLAKLEC